jgi:O-methyltransferase
MDISTAVAPGTCATCGGPRWEAPERRSSAALRTLLQRSAGIDSLVQCTAVVNRLCWKLRLYAAAREHEFPTFGCEAEFNAHLNRAYCEGGRSAIDFLEFGVYDGDSLRVWTGLNTNAVSRFVGFDSFEGLPEAWTKEKGQGAFSTGGVAPGIPDDRITYEVGWFQQTLRGFLATYEPANRLIVHCDADLYSSTLYALTTLDPFVPPGTLVIFDEFFDASHEFRALQDYCCAFRREYRIVAATKNLLQAAVELV